MVALMKEYGIVVSMRDGVAKITGISDVRADELVIFKRSGVSGIVLNLENNFVGVAVFATDDKVREGDTVLRTNKILQLNVSEKLLGRVVDALGHVIDSSEPLTEGQAQLIDVKAPGIVARESVKEPLQTGIMAIDSMIPIGRGQRELIIGDRQTGKTAIAVDAIINQRDA